MWDIRIEIDVMPITLYPGESIDYMGNFIGRQLSIPMFSKSKTDLDFLIQNISSDASCKDWFIELRKDCYWSNGDPIESKNIVGAFKNISEGRSVHAWLAYYLDFEKFPFGVEICDTHSLTVKFKRSMSCFPEILESCIVPIPDENQANNISSGNYLITHVLDDGQGIVAEKSLKGRENLLGPDRIIFACTKSGKHGVNLFENKLIDITCNTTFPIDSVVKYKVDYQAFETKLVGQLQFNEERIGEDWLLFKLNVDQVINRQEVTRKISELVRPLSNYIDAWEPDKDRLLPIETDKLGKAFSKNKFRIMYADFDPNGFVVEEIAKQIKKNLGVELIPDPVSYTVYFQRVARRDYDLIYALQSAPFDHPMSFFMPEREKQLSKSKFSNVLDKALEPTGEMKDYHQCETLFRLVGTSIPILSVNSVFLSRYKIEKEHCDYNGHIDFAQLDRNEQLTF